MTESIVILPARLEWADSFRLCLDQVSREKRYFLMTEAPPLEKVREFLMRLNTLGHPQYFALQGPRVVGWCNVKRIEVLGREHVGELSMGVMSGYRQKGIGKRLAEACLRESRLANFHRVELTVFTDNKAAIRLYESLGFENEGTLKDFAKLPSGFKDAHLMAQII